MGLLKSIEKMRLGFQGKTPAVMPGSLRSSKLHDTFSINGQPGIAGKGAPSLLDLNGNTPTQYIDNLPG